MRAMLFVRAGGYQGKSIARMARSYGQCFLDDDMTTILYGLKNCDTCKKATKWLDRFGVAHAFVDYRDNRQAAETLAEWAAKAGGWDALINKSSTTWRQLPENRKSPGSDAEWKLLLKEYPQLIRRPVVVTGEGGFSQGFSDNGFKKLFGVDK